MNERIEEFAKDCKILGEKEFAGKVVGFNYKKFAELIIQDCMEAVDGYTMARTFETYYDAVAQIEALFGVKYERED